MTGPEGFASLRACLYLLNTGNMPNFTLTTIGRDNFNRADSSTLGANWNTPSGSGSIGIQSNQAYGEGLRPAQTYWNTSVQANQFAQITWEGSPSDPLTGYIDITLRRNPASDTHYWIVSLNADGSTGAYTADNSNRGGYDDSWNLPAPLNTGDVILTVAYGPAIYVFVNGTLVHTSTLPQVSPTGGTADGSGCAGFDLSYVGNADNWSVGTAAQAPVLSASPLSLSYTPCPLAGIAPNSSSPQLPIGTVGGSQNLTVSNSGSGSSLPFTVSSSVSWLIPSIRSADCGSAPVTVGIQLNLNSDLPGGAVGLKSGTYQATITVSSAYGTATINVSLTLAAFGIP